MLMRYRAIGFVLALAHAQSSDDSLSIPTGSQAPTSTPGSQAAVQNDAQSRQLSESSSGAGSCTYVPTTTASAFFSFDPAQQSSWTYMPTTTQDTSYTYMPTDAENSSPTPERTLSSSEQPSFVFAPSSTTDTTTEAMASSLSPTNTTQSSDIRPVQQSSVTTMTSGPSNVMSDSSPNTEMGTVETVQTMQTQSELMAPTFSSNYTWVPTTTTAMGVPLFPTGFVYAPHVEHLGSTLQGPQATSGLGLSTPGNIPQSAALPVYEAPQSSSGDADTSLAIQQSPSSAHGSNAPPVVPAYHNEPAPTTFVTASHTATRSGETAVSPAIMQGIGGMSSAAQASATTALSPAAFMSIMAEIFPLEGYASPTSAAAGAGPSPPTAAPANAMPTTQSGLVYEGKTVQMSGMTLDAEPTSASRSQVGGNSLVATGTSQSQPALASSGAGVVNMRTPFVMAAVAIWALIVI